MRRELDKQLAAAAAASGARLDWTAQEREVLELISSTIDRKCDLQADYAAASEPKVRVKLSAEIRLLEAAVARMLRQVKTEAPQQLSLRSLKAQRAAWVRWDRDQDREGRSAEIAEQQRRNAEEYRRWQQQFDAKVERERCDGVG